MVKDFVDFYNFQDFFTREVEFREIKYDKN